MKAFFIDEVIDSLDMYLQATTPSFEYPRTDLPSHIRFIGPLLAASQGDTMLPDWWGKLKQDRPVILVTQGTVATDSHDLILPTIEALSRKDVFVIVVTGDVDSPVKQHQLSENIRVETYIPYDKLLPYVDVMISNAGYGGVQMALAYGVPMVVSGDTEEKGEICARVEWAGVGISIKPERLTPEAIASAVTAILERDRYKQNVRRLQAEFAKYNAPKNAVDLMESILPGKK